MFFETLSQLILASGLSFLFPFDAATLEGRMYLPSSAVRERRDQAEDVRLFVARRLPQAGSRVPTRMVEDRLGVVTSAVSAVVVDVASGAVLFEKNPSATRSIGSVTKLMTALVFLQQQTDVSASAEILPEDIRMGGQQHIPMGEMVTIRDLLFASLVSSDNSATAALVRISGLSQGDFVARMNEMAAEIGMTSTRFADPTGLSVENRAVALDVVFLLRASLQQPLIAEAARLNTTTITSASGKLFPLENTNGLLESFLQQPPYELAGGKTGFLPEAGYCLGVQVRRGGGEDIMVVVLGSSSVEAREADVKALAAWTYATYRWPPASVARAFPR